MGLDSFIIFIGVMTLAGVFAWYFLLKKKDFDNFMYKLVLDRFGLKIG